MFVLHAWVVVVCVRVFLLVMSVLKNVEKDCGSNMVGTWAMKSSGLLGVVS